ncbi:MAG: 50S ribosomal protein L37ae [Candidatus Methanomethylicota archaeon]|uniref:Large ribosomal subunit protein eL43 n=1 Tax=Thermoproteota archaeon TaxID=2056631 RepID=A0A497ESC9_9CREN|nr:MAG: 50S ribosomal protein L37ae [Candidatus Verstraetearchaeota archaeon]
MGRTRFIGPVARYGAKYGATVRKRVLAIELKMRAPSKCPRCRTPGSLKRLSFGVWVCKFCGLKFAGGAYVPQTVIGKTFAPEELKGK